MPIKKGKEWGEPAEPPSDLVIVGSDAEARALLEEARRDRRPYPAIGLRGGDLCRTLGGEGGGNRGGRLSGVRFPVDLGVALLDGRIHLFMAHLVARSRLWTRAFVAMNAQWVGNRNLGPRAHPGDGLLDTYDVRLSLGQVVAVAGRARHGAHLPHPGVTLKRAGAVQVNLERPLPVRLDGKVVTRAASISVRVDPDALVIYV